MFVYTQTLKDFNEQLLNKTCQLFPHGSSRETLMPYLPHSNAPTAYDAVWSLALAWNEAIPELISNRNICAIDNRLGLQNETKEAVSDSLRKVILNGISVS